MENGRIFTADGYSSNNGTKATPNISADIFGDWREEVIFRSNDNSSLRIFTTTDTSHIRRYTLMHDAVYRLSVAWQNVAYNQPPHVGYYMPEGSPQPNIIYPDEYVNVTIEADHEQTNEVDMFHLEQNYPNPFNPTTTINYSLPKAGNTTLSIYNLSGQKVAQLVSESLPQGHYSIQWDASGLASGVYFYRLESGSYSQTRRLVLIK